MEKETKAKHDSMLSTIAENGTKPANAAIRAVAIVTIQKEASAAYRAVRAVKERNRRSASHYDVCKATMALLGPGFLDRLLTSSAPDVDAATMGRVVSESASMASAYSGMASRTSKGKNEN